MTFQKYIVPAFVSAQLFGQTERDVFHQLGFGVTHSTFTNFCFQKEHIKPPKAIRGENQTLLTKTDVPTITEFQSGFSLGYFNDIPLSQAIVLRTIIDASYSINYKYQQNHSVYSTYIGIKVKPSLNIALQKANPNGIIYLARNMSCYLTYKQPYMSIAPIVSYQKFDSGFLRKGFNNEIAWGASVGYGINYEFHGTNIAPEINYQITTTLQHKLFHSISFILNVF